MLCLGSVTAGGAKGTFISSISHESPSPVSKIVQRSHSATPETRSTDDDVISTCGKGRVALRASSVQDNAWRISTPQAQMKSISPNSRINAGAATTETLATSGEEAASEIEVQIDSLTKHEAEDTGERLALLVENNDVNTKLLVALMKNLKIKNRCAIHGKETYDSYRNLSAGYFLILMDVSMPAMDGFAATSKIRAFETRQRLPQTRMVALTGVTNEQAERQAFDAGVDAYYANPVRMKELRELVDRTRQSEQTWRGSG